MPRVLQFHTRNVTIETNRKEVGGCHHGTYPGQSLNSIQADQLHGNA